MHQLAPQLATDPPSQTRSGRPPHLLGGKHQDDRGSRMGVSGCSSPTPSGSPADGPARPAAATATPPMPVLLALLMLALEPDDE